MRDASTARIVRKNGYRGQLASMLGECAVATAKTNRRFIDSE